MNTKKLAIGIDFGGTYVKVGLVNRRGRILNKSVITTGRHKRPADLVLALADYINSVIKDRRLDKKDIAGIGMGIPGFVSPKGVVYSLTNVSGWRNFPLKNAMEKRTKIRAFIDNDANVMGLAELIFGAARGFKNAICVTLGTGVGGAVIIDGELYRGQNFLAGEIGHIPINETGPKCRCKGYGCLERYVGSRYIVNSFIRKIRLEKKKGIVMKIVKGDYSKITPRILSDAARLNDKVAISIWKETGEHLGTALSGVINLLNPAVIVIGGGISGVGKPLFDSIKNTIKKRSIPLLSRNIKIMKASLGDEAGVIGAACLAFEVPRHK